MRTSVLVITNYLYPELKANSEIAYRLGDELKKKFNTDVSILGMGKHRQIVSPYEVMQYPICALYKCTQIENESITIRRLVKYLLNPDVFILKLSAKANGRTVEQLAYEKAIRRILRGKRIDCIIGFAQPNWLPELLSEMTLSVPYIVYRLDPYFSHYNNVGVAQNKSLEADINAAALIVTELMYKEYRALNDEAILSHIHWLEFPNLRQLNPTAKMNRTELYSGKVNCVFMGNLYKDIRNPQYTINLFRTLADTNIVLHIFGGFFGDKCIEVDKLPPNVIYHGTVSPDEAEAITVKADILLNIGNTVTNQMPSKIITYIASGIPIINIVKHKQCPTLAFTERYPLALNLIENEESVGEVRDKVLAFCRNNTGVRIPFQDIVDIYKSCTPEYVAEKLHEIICEVIDDKIVD